VVQALERVADTRGIPDELVIDMAPSSSAKRWTRGPRRGASGYIFIDPGKPMQNAFIESFNGRFRDDYVNESWFTTLADARHTIDAWRQDYNTQRPHSSLGDRTPDEFEQFTKNRAPEPSSHRRWTNIGGRVNICKSFKCLNSLSDTTPQRIVRRLITIRRWDHTEKSAPDFQELSNFFPTDKNIRSMNSYFVPPAVHRHSYGKCRAIADVRRISFGQKIEPGFLELVD
jgi:hypothetical protein